MPRERDPFPLIKCENDNTFMGKRECQKLPYSKPTHLAQNDQPWSRLNDCATLTSTRRNVFYNDPEAPKDSLDFHLKSLYNHHQEFLRDRNETLFQKETVTDDHGRILKNRVKEEPVDNSIEKAELREWVNAQKLSIHSFKGTIEGHHNASTNRGYSRKEDGGFYTI